MAELKITGLTIGEVAEQSNIATSALRYYESAGLITPPQRVSGQRRYSSSVLPKIAFIKLAQQAGFTINQIRTLMEGFDEAEEVTKASCHAMVYAKIAEIDELIQRAHKMKDLLQESLECNFKLCAECLSVEPPLKCATYP